MVLSREEEAQFAVLPGTSDVEVEDRGHIIGCDGSIVAVRVAGIGIGFGDRNDQMWEFIAAVWR